MVGWREGEEGEGVRDRMRPMPLKKKVLWIVRTMSWPTSPLERSAMVLECLSYCSTFGF